MLIGEVFEEFIGVVKENKQYTIGLVNEKQIITLCSNKNKIGQQINVQSIDKNNVFFEVNVKNQGFGYLWVSGEDENLQMISKLFYESLTVRLLYEINQATLNRKVTKDDEVVKLLLSKDFDTNQVLELFSELEIDVGKSRIAIYVVSDDGFNMKDVMRLKMHPESKEIIFSLLNRKSLLIYKDIPSHCKTTREIRMFIRMYVKSLLELDLHGCYYFVGSIQNKLRNYEVSYQNCFWLKNNVNFELDKPVFFSDYLYEYFISNVENDKIRGVFDYYLDSSKNINVDEFIEISDKLFVNDFNLTQTAEELFLHKNTLIYKLKKYEEVFQIDIRGEFQGKVIFMLISYALRDYRKRIRVGEGI